MKKYYSFLIVLILIVIGGTIAQAYSPANLEISSLDDSSLLDKFNFPPAPATGFIYILGGQKHGGNLKDVWISTPSEIYKNHWKQLTDNPSWGQPMTYTPKGVYFKDKLWIITGDGNSNPPQVSYSTDGVSWANTPTPPWGPRDTHAVVVFNDGGGDAIWMLGGRNGALIYNDIWKTYDGFNWIQVTSNAPWAGIYGHNLLSYNGELWVIGGASNNSSPIFQIWHSSDGVNWAQATTNAPLGYRGMSSVVVFNNKMWVLGGLTQGGDANDTWYSNDGINWTQATAQAAWSGRHYHASVVFDNKMWVLGGIVWPGVLNDAWYSSDGINWFQTSPLQMPWVARGAHTAIVKP